MQDNVYAPPKANLEGPFADAGPAPALWNPNAAASWSLLFTPVFGTWLHWRNWLAMGEADRARTARYWFIAAVVVVLATVALSVLLPTISDGVLRAINIGCLIAWFYGGAKPQVLHVRARFGATYPRRGWIVPILAAIGVLAAVILLIAAVVVVAGRV